MKYYCCNCDSTYTTEEVMFNDYVSRYCPFCFRMGESPSDCVLLFKEEIM